MCNFELGDKSQQQTTNFTSSDWSVMLPNNHPKSSSMESEGTQSSLKDPSRISSEDYENTSGGNLINILSDKQKYSSIWHLIYQQVVPSEESMAENEGIKSPCQDEDNQGAVMEKVDFDQTSAVKLVQGALDAILQRDGQSSDQQAIPDQEMSCSPREKISIPAVLSEDNARETGEVAIETPSPQSEDKMHEMEHEGEALQQKAESDDGAIPVRNMSKSLNKLRKAIVTAKFIKAMEKLRKTSPGKPRYLSSEPSSEEERVYLRHLSMNGRKNVEEWMLDFALRKVVSRLGPDEQRRVALLVEAFETLTPDNNETSIKCYPVKGETAPGIELATPKCEETNQHAESKQERSFSDEEICKKQDEGSLYHKDITKERSLREELRHETTWTGDKILQPDETVVPLESFGTRTTSIERAFEEPITGNEESVRTPEAPFQLSLEDYEANPAGDMNNVLFDKKKYTSIWNMIYQHVTSTEASTEGNQGVYMLHEKDQGSDENTCQEADDLDSIQSSYSTDHEEDEDNQSASREKHELNQSAAIKLVKEAVNAILQHYELSSGEHQDKAADNVRGLCNATPYSTEEISKGEDKKATTSEPEILEKKSGASMHQVESNGSQGPHKKKSKSLSKLKRAIVTTKFIKAMERLRKMNSQKTRPLFSEAASEEDRIHLRHLSMNGRKNSEEWMLDYALRQVISKLAPDQQKRVALLVEAFETVNPERKEDTRYYPLKDGPATGIPLVNPANKELKQLPNSEQERSIFDEKVHQKKDDRFPLSHVSFPAQRSLQGDHDHQVSRTGNSTQQVTDRSVVSNSTSEKSTKSSISAYADNTVQEKSIRVAETVATSKVNFLSPTGGFEAGIGDITSILSDKQKYTSLWHLIYQHATPSEASITGKQKDDEADEDEQDEDENNSKEMNGLDATNSTEITNQPENENNQITGCKEHEFESAAIKLVKEAISAILQYDEKRSDEQSLQKHDTAADSSGGLRNKPVSASIKENSVRWRTAGEHESSVPENKLNTSVNENLQVERKAEANKVMAFQKSSSKSFSKLRKVFITAKFMKAMERMRRINMRQPQYLSPDAAPEAERVNLKHQEINDQRNSEEWMLDHALRKVISNLAPEQQRRVALLVEAFETVTPEQKGSGIRSYMKSEGGPVIHLGSTANRKETRESEHDNCTSCDQHIHQNPSDKSTLLDEAARKRSSPVEEHPPKFLNLKTELHEEVLDLDSNNSHSHLQVSSKGCPEGDTLNIWTERKETYYNLESESLEGVPLSVGSEQDDETNITKGIFSITQKQTSMWQLIYQHAKSVTAAEAENSVSERSTGKDQLGNGNVSSEMTADADADDSDASSVTSELTESEAVKLVRDAISDILAVPQELDNDLFSRDVAASSDEDQRAGEVEKPEKTLSRGYSKLRKLIICNKFIQAMEKAKMRKSHPRNRKNQIINVDQEAETVNLKPSTVGEKKSTDELLLDHALQKVIAGLAPVQQRRVALLVAAFEKVSPDTEEIGKRFTTTGTAYPSSAGNAEEQKDPSSESSQNSSQIPHDFSLKLHGSLTSTGKEVATDSALEEMSKEMLREKTPIMSSKDWINNLSSITAATSDVNVTKSNDLKDPAESKSRDMPYCPVQQEEVTSVDVNYSELTAKTAENPAHPEDSEDKGNPRTKNDKFIDKVQHTSPWHLLAQHVNSEILEETETQIPGDCDANARECELDKNDHSQSSSQINHDLENEWNPRPENDMSFDKVRHTSLWRLLVQHVNTDILEETDTQMPGEIDANARELELDKSDQYQSSSKENLDADMNVQMPKSLSFELQEKEAIKVVQEALDAILTCDDQSTTTSKTSDQESCTENQGHQGEPSLVDSEAKTEEEQRSEEKLSNTYSKLSKVILCKRFIKAMDKMRKIKPQSPQEHSQQPQSEEKTVHQMRQTVSTQRKIWEEWMLDHAMQQVVGNLAPAQKKRVSLLVQAFETVSSQPEPGIGQKGKATGF